MFSLLVLLVNSLSFIINVLILMEDEPFYISEDRTEVNTGLVRLLSCLDAGVCMCFLHVNE